MSTQLNLDKKPKSNYEQITTAVAFLSDVSPKNYRELDLRKYLSNKRGLTNLQIDEAFRIHRRGMLGKEPSTSTKSSSPDPRSPMTGGRKSRLEKVKKAREVGAGAVMSALRARLASPKALTVLLKDKHSEGYKLLNDFLEGEKEYCTILQCLNEDYYKELYELAGNGKVKMTREEVNEIFSGIPSLAKFHKLFYEQLYQGVNIGLLFVQNFNVFKEYIEYMKNCKVTIDIMRKHLRDKNLHKHLAQIRQRSRRKRDDMVDLLLVPLDRIMACKQFLDKLTAWGDKAQNDDFVILAKAMRRIGRVANYMERYKYGISNRNEMNKVQQFLEKQCDIISPNRKIIRRGTMIRRTTGWAARNKTYVFFLFNDVLLWTTQNRELQNILQLDSCEVMPSDAKNDSERKFKIISKGRKNKTLLLECTSRRQRDEWYKAAEKGIAAAKKPGTTAWVKPEFKPKPEEEEVTSDVKSNIERKPVVPGAPDENKEGQTGEANTYDNKEADEPVAYDDNVLDSYYKESRNFTDQTLKDFDAFDDSMSQISEIDNEFNNNYNKGQEASTTALLSPFNKKSPELFLEDNANTTRLSRSSFKISEHQGDRDSHENKVNFAHERNQNGRQKQESEEEGGRNTTSIIRRPKKKTAISRKHNRNSSFTVRLNDL